MTYQSLLPMVNQKGGNGPTHMVTFQMFMWFGLALARSCLGLSVIVFVAFSLFAVTLAKITGLFNKIGARRAGFEEQLSHCRKFMRDQKIPAQTQDSVFNYLEFLFDKGRVLSTTGLLVNAQHLRNA